MIDKETIELILAKTTSKSIGKGDILLRKGEPSNHLYVVIKGCLRSYFIDKKGKEHIVQFAQEGCTIGDYESLIKDTPAVLNIAALESSVVNVFNKKDAETILGSKIELLRIGNKLYHDQIISLQKRVIQLLSGTADERYIEFVKVYPNLLNRVSQKMIASYLGITPESLSRVRNEILKRK
ncbi:MAG TPA: Crp/Fnr family transcriptional regulator [Bacteroidia bacterium]|jgi:CRP-like cAMP-binding protein|nr:Crp/Fnr family transcriptional regulator [Bacteroidia bacterium]